MRDAPLKWVARPPFRVRTHNFLFGLFERVRGLSGVFIGLGLRSDLADAAEESPRLTSRAPRARDLSRPEDARRSESNRWLFGFARGPATEVRRQEPRCHAMGL
jgi:hypothetical protein